MTIRRGEQWGTEVDVRDGIRIATTDAELAELIRDDPTGAYGVSAGDLHRTVGNPTPGRETLWELPIDVLHVRTESSLHLAVAHVVIGRSSWFGSPTFICNVDHVGRWNIAPRAHPNDGRFDVVAVDRTMTLRDRFEFRRRLPTGRHVPHPSVAVSTATVWSWSDSRGARVRIDGQDIGDRHDIEISIEPDAAAVLV